MISAITPFTLFTTIHSAPFGTLTSTLTHTLQVCTHQHTHTLRESRTPFPLTHYSLQYAWPPYPLSQCRNNLSVRCFVKGQRLFTLSQTRVVVGMLNLAMEMTVMMRRIWPGKWGLWLMNGQICFLKCDVLPRVQDCYWQVLLSLIMTKLFSFQINRTKDQTGRKLSAFSQWSHRNSSTATQVGRGRSSLHNNKVSFFLASAYWTVEEERCAVNRNLRW